MLFALAWTALLLVLLFLPGTWIPSVPDAAPFVVHVALFGVSGVLWGRAFPSRIPTVLGMLALLGVATEAVQSVGWIGRGTEGIDLVADAVGLVLAWVVLVAARAMAGDDRAA